MAYDQVERGPLQKYYLKSGKPKFRMEIAHHGLNKHKLIKGDYPEVVTRKAEVELSKWDEQWARRKQKEAEARRKKRKLQLAEERTAEARRELKRLEQLLAHTLTVDDTIEWDDLENHSPFPEPQPEAP